MIFTCWDLNTKRKVFEYQEKHDNHNCNLIKNFDFKIKGCQCNPNRYFLSRIYEEKNLIFAFCFNNVKTKKPAKFFAKQAIQMFISMAPVLDKKQKDYEEIVKASVHSSRNLNSEITTKLLHKLNEKNLSKSTDKVEYIVKLLKNNPRDFAREILSILRLSTQINTEYNIVDYLKPNINIPKSEFGYHKVHSILVLAFYQFERDFSEKDIFVKINNIDEYAYCNFNTVQTILVNIFTNALRYCMENTQMIISTTCDSEYLSINMFIRSLYLTDDIIKNGRINGKRTEQAKKKHEKGTGLGIGIISRLAELNKGNFSYNRQNDKEYNDGEFIYSDNIFTLTLLNEEFY